MNFNKLLTVALACGLANVALAQPLPKQNFNSANKVIGTPGLSSAEFGSYKIEPQLKSVPSSVAAMDNVVATRGNMSIVKVAPSAEPELAGKGTIVRSLLTNQLTTLTGNVTVLLNKNAIASELATKVGMEVVSVFPGTDIAILKIVEGQDLVAAFNKLKQSGLVVESKVEVTDTIYSAR